MGIRVISRKASGVKCLAHIKGEGRQTSEVQWDTILISMSCELKHVIKLNISVNKFSFDHILKMVEN